MSQTSLRVFRPILQNLIVSRTTIRYYAKVSGGTGPGVAVAGLGKKGKGTKGPVLEKKRLDVETDPVRLVNYVCGSDITNERDDVKLKDDSEYPDWLWTLETEGHRPIEELSPDTHEYWFRARKLAIQRNNRLRKWKKFS